MTKENSKQIVESFLTKEVDGKFVVIAVMDEEGTSYLDVKVPEGGDTDLYAKLIFLINNGTIAQEFMEALAEDNTEESMAVLTLWQKYIKTQSEMSDQPCVRPSEVFG